MAAYVAAVGATAHANAANITIVLPSGGASAPQANDIIWLIVSSGDTGSHAVTGYTQLYSTSVGTDHKRSIWWARAAGGDSNPTVTYGGAQTIGGQAIVVRGAKTSGNPYSTSSESANLASLAITFATITPASGELCLMIGTAGDNDTSTSCNFSAPSGTNPTFSYSTGLAASTNHFEDGTTEVGFATLYGSSADGSATGSRTLAQDKSRANIGTLIAIASDTSWTGPVFQDRGVSASGTANISPAWPPHAVDDVALLIIESTGGQPANLGTAAGFAAVTNSPQATGAGTIGTQITVYWCRATSTSMATPTVTDPGDHAYGVIVTFRGCIGSGNPWDVTAGSVKASATGTTTWDSVTTTVANALVINTASRDNDSNLAAWSNFAGGNCTSLGELHDEGTLNGNGGGIVVNLSKLAAAGATGAPTATVTASINTEMTIALKPPTPVTAFPPLPNVVDSAVARSTSW